MGRRKKEVIVPVEPEDPTCPVCGKQFKITEDSCYLIGRQYTCGAKCFLDFVKARETEKKDKCKQNVKKEH